MHNADIIQKIKNEHVRPISRSIFMLKKVLVWFLLAISTVFGAYAFAFFFLKTLYIDFDNWHYFASSYDRFLIDNIPVIWVCLFVLSLMLIFYLFKKTNKGYRHSIVFIAATSLVVSFSLGIFLSKVLAKTAYIMDRFENERIMSWTNPESGRLSGEVLFIDEDYMLVRDIKDDIWNIDISNVLDNSRQVLNEYEVVSIVGRYDYENNFTACQIMPLHMDKMKFKPDRGNVFERKVNKDNDFVKNICDFVIKNN